MQKIERELSPPGKTPATQQPASITAEPTRDTRTSVDGLDARPGRPLAYDAQGRRPVSPLRAPPSHDDDGPAPELGLEPFLKGDGEAQVTGGLVKTIANELITGGLERSRLLTRLRKLPSKESSARLVEALGVKCQNSETKAGVGHVHAQSLLTEGIRQFPQDIGLTKALSQLYTKLGSRQDRKNMLWRNQGTLKASKLEELKAFLAEAEHVDRQSYYGSHIAIYKLAAIGLACSVAGGALYGAIYGVERWACRTVVSDSGIVVSWEELYADKSLAAVAQLATRCGLGLGTILLLGIVPLALYDAYHLWAPGGGTA